MNHSLNRLNKIRIRRQEDIALAYMSGATLDDIAEVYMISRERVRQIVNLYKKKNPVDFYFHNSGLKSDTRKFLRKTQTELRAKEKRYKKQFQHNYEIIRWKNRTKRDNPTIKELAKITSMSPTGLIYTYGSMKKLRERYGLICNNPNGGRPRKEGRK